jgi:hypothetical protein
MVWAVAGRGHSCAPARVAWEPRGAGRTLDGGVILTPGLLLGAGLLEGGWWERREGSREGRVEGKEGVLGLGVRPARPGGLV